LFLGGKHS